MTGIYIVTGGTHGIGAACVEHLASKRAKVLCVGRDAKKGSEIAGAFSRVTFCRADVSDEADCKAAVDLALTLGDGQIAGLVNNAGMSMRRAFIDTTAGDWDRIFAVNTRSVYLFTRLSLPGLIKSKGSVVSVSSVAGMTGAEGMAAYCASKAALIGLTQALALEHGKDVRFNVICPGQVNTRMMASTMANPTILNALLRTIPVERIADPREVAEVVGWLLSSNSSFINGAVIPVDGGETAGIQQLRFE
ncbi:SDR family NAD(P)-dependent oxidoreductase [Mesorhizobium sp.]|uniref:SDR family NAD(P)-dependent oxidoreductase n=1 Tax=Mesorhizobium sp. TaxID=1871066 RepID=UPI000FE7AFCA|nr:SDR family NAD(P)-dependent oxidoreductase [Mesorhizobium sp.]RWB42848.1 MAG: SDR family oxidoreductase [Mesorhizobium sp.]RWB64852.1 MAG: SDR family oxidoreductase [Mesorhizobium sp.]RWB88188.1 MAG: SDR family oxidoreductase [Mesorhizobium sp.]RWC16751.1 MAG: SDR family oxidoreductase [Mesorhizobium sp.]RWD77276.1 MAG: SDR family oxidoreductase [Mesorhizobium sp.]